MKHSRIQAAVLALIVVLAGLWSFGRAYREHRALDDAREVLASLGRMQEAHRRMQGVYTEDLSALADMSENWSGFMEALDKILDLRAGFEMVVAGRTYRITAHARDRRRSIVILEGPPKSVMSAVRTERTR